MADATLSRGGTSVTFHIWEEAGQLLIARDIGKPEGGVKQASSEDPPVSDHKSALDVLTVIGRVTGPDAYADAQTLAEDLVKPHSDGVELQLDLSAVTGFETYDVGVPDQSALQLDYRPGIKNAVDLQLTVPIVEGIIG